MNTRRFVVMNEKKKKELKAFTLPFSDDNGLPSPSRAPAQPTMALLGGGRARHGGSHPCLRPAQARARRRTARPGIPRTAVAAATPTPPPPPRRGLRILETAGGALPLQGALVKTARTAWTTAWKAMVTELAPQDDGGGFARPASTFPGPTRPGDWPLAEAGRARLYLGNACPWCHRVAIAAYLRGYAVYDPGNASPPSKNSNRSGAIAITRLVDDPARARRGGWALPLRQTDSLTGAPDLKGVYDALNPGGRRPYAGRCTAPLLVDGRTRTIVSNDSAAILAALDGPAASIPGVTLPLTLRPPALAPAIDALNADLYDRVCNGVYKCGFATSGAAYGAAAAGVAAGLADADARLAASRFLMGDRFTDADARLFPTVVRLDAVYGPLFRATAGPLAALWPHVAAWAADVWRLRVPIATTTAAAAGGGGDESGGGGGGGGGASSLSLGPATVDIEAARQSYYSSLFPLNPSGILPIQPAGVGWFDSAEGRAAAEGRGGVGRVEEVFYVRE
jgi:glutathionyl-hydroquinone reductase